MISIGRCFRTLVLITIGAVYCIGTNASESVTVTELTDGLSNPWGVVQLPNGDFLINERPGTMRRFSKGVLSEPIQGVPDVVAKNQGGLLGLSLDPDFDDNKMLYFCYSSPGEGGATSTVASAELNFNRLENVKTFDSKGDANLSRALWNHTGWLNASSQCVQSSSEVVFAFCIFT